MSELTPGKKLKSLRTKASITQKQLATVLSKSESAVRMWELDKNEPDIHSLKALSKIFECSIDELLVNEVSYGKSELSTNIPIYNEYYLDDNKNFKGFSIPLPHNLSRATGEYIAIKQSDNSMSPNIIEGDTIIVKKQDTCFNSQIASIIIGDAPAVLRKVLFQGSGIVLQPLNPTYPSVFFDGSSIEKLPIIFVGIVVNISRDFIV